MRIAANLALPFGVEDEELHFFSAQFRELPDKLWWRDGEFTTLAEAINETARLREIWKDRNVETRIVAVSYKPFKQDMVMLPI